MKFPRPFKNWSTYPGHLGIDYPEPDDTMVKASGKGIVTFSGKHSKDGGWGVSVTYDNGQVHKYKHSDEHDWRANVGTPVEKGDNIMEIGTSGLSSGYHLHHEVFVNGWIQTGDNYWKYVDKTENAYVGYSNPADNNSNKPITTPNNEEEEEMKARQIHYTENGVTTRALLVPGTGYFMPYTSSSSKYANDMAKNMETNSSTEVTKSLFNAFKAAAERCQTLVGNIAITNADN